jgi:hypothetical protein
MANTYEANPVPGNLHLPGAVYCNNADCTGQSIQSGPNTTSTPNSTGRIDPPWVKSEGWQGFSGQNSFLEFGKTPFAAGENGGIHGHVVYASTRPFDDPTLLLQTSWEPLVPGVTINLYSEGTAPDGSVALNLVDSTKTSSWDDWAQGFRPDGVPNMNCPGQSTSDMFYFTLYNQPNYLDFYNSQHGGAALTPLPDNAQFKCYDGMHNWNQLQAAPYDGRYEFPSIVERNPTNGVPMGPTVTIASISEAGNTVTVTTSSPINLLSGARVTVAGVTPTGYNGTFVVAVTGPNTITYTDPTTGLASAAVGTVALPATLCTICGANPTDATSPMLPAGKYVVEVVVPPGYELVKKKTRTSSSATTSWRR